MLTRGTIEDGKDKIGLRVGAIINKYKMAKHFVLDIQDQNFEFQRQCGESGGGRPRSMGSTCCARALPKKRLSTEDTVRSYKSLSQVERAFRSMKTMDLKVRPIHHRLEDRVRAHIFLLHVGLLCRMAYARSMALCAVLR